jgi:hypothetical protein
VARRLDAVLADLITEGVAADPAPAEPAPVVPITRRRWTRGLLAAAAVVVAGVGVTNVLTRTGGDDGSGAAGGNAVMDSDSGGSAAEEGAGGGGDQESARTPESVPSASARGALDGRMLDTGGPVVLSSKDLDGEFRALLRTSPSPVTPETTSGGTIACLPPVLAQGQFWAPATYDGRSAVLVTSDPDRRPVVAVVYSCAGVRLGEVSVDPGR